ncbi:hypothetical protein [Streptomyces sp. NPDC002276]
MTEVRSQETGVSRTNFVLGFLILGSALFAVGTGIGLLLVHGNLNDHRFLIASLTCAALGLGTWLAGGVIYRRHTWM